MVGYKSPKKRNKKDKLLVKALMIGLAVIAFWRGAWGLMDIFLFPQYPVFSYIFSIILGMGILLGTHYFVRELM